MNRDPILPNTVFQGDCRDLFARLPDNSVDLILTDPPYKDYQSNRPVAHQKVTAISASTFDLPHFIREAERVLKPGCHFYCWCDHLSFPAIFETIQARTQDLSPRLAGGRLKYKNCLIWVKNNHGSGDLAGNYAPQHELVIYASKGRTRPLQSDKRPSNVFFEKDNQGRISFYSKVSNYRFQHGTSKPMAILRRMIQTSSKRGEVVFDPYGGSLSTAEAAVREGRHYLVGELDPGHCERGLERLRLLNEELRAETYDERWLIGPEFVTLEPAPRPHFEKPTSGSSDCAEARAATVPLAAGPRELPDLLRGD